LQQTLHISFYPELSGHNQTRRTTHMASAMSDNTIYTQNQG